MNCYECSRFGREPTPEQREHWDEVAAEHPDIWDRTVMMDDLEEPYPSGMWAGYTRQCIENRAKGGGRYVHGKEGQRGLSMRPRLMPHEVRLPVGVTSAIMPAGIYLCKQCGEGEHDTVNNLLLGIAMSIEHHEFTVAEERELFEASLNSQFPRHEGRSGPIMEPFAMPRSPGDPRMAGWWKAVEHADMHKLVLPIPHGLRARGRLLRHLHQAAHGRPKRLFPLRAGDPRELP